MIRVFIGICIFSVFLMAMPGLMRFLFKLLLAIGLLTTIFYWFVR